jgi:[protein-PII] uridylyltransferase
MATKSFLTEVEITDASARLKAPARAPDGDERRGLSLDSRDFSAWLGQRLLARLSSHADWAGSEPVIVGSWARDELSPKSDIDLLFLGPEEGVKRLVQDFSRQGLKLRYRVPEDLNDWTKGVEPFDVLALFSAVPVTPASSEKLARQLEKLRNRTGSFRRELLKAMKTERRARAERYDSISSFLEPNLKFGPGGLRDLEQALVTRQLFPERFSDERNDHAFIVLLYYKTFFLYVRQKLHLSPGATDVLTAPEQKPLSDWLGFKAPKEFMREIQKGLARVSFYADWVIAQASSSGTKVREVETRPLKSVGALFTALEADPSILMQNHVRLASDQVFAQADGLTARKRARLDRLVGRRLTHILDPAMPEESMVAVFRSRLVDHCIPDFRKIVGYVQHDQYHRFSVDAHLLQVLRELKRLRATPRRAGRIASRVRALSTKQWEILAFACLFHDLAKGRGGDHAEKGVELAQRELARFGKSDALIKEVAWIVEEHLAMSAAAFRENPRSPRTWSALADKGVKGERISLLTVFTIVDILGTNPDAWTPWKERLLFELAEQLERPETDKLLALSEGIKKSGVRGAADLSERLTETLDPFLVSSIPVRVLLEDFRQLGSQKNSKSDLEPRAVAVSSGRQTWIRLHSAIDRPGLFLGFVRRLAACGLGVRHASILTDTEIGVYDWFEVKTSKTPAQLQKLVGNVVVSGSKEKTYDVRFDAIELVSSDEREWTISFRGRDQSGALTAAARALFDAGAEVRWAKVHTWGRQIDDVFGIAALRTEPKALIEQLVSSVGVKI